MAVDPTLVECYCSRTVAVEVPQGKQPKGFSAYIVETAANATALLDTLGEPEGVRRNCEVWMMLMESLCVKLHQQVMKDPDLAKSLRNPVLMVVPLNGVKGYDSVVAFLGTEEKGKAAIIPIPISMMEHGLCVRCGKRLVVQ